MTTKRFFLCTALALAGLSLFATSRLAEAWEKPTEYRAEGTWQSESGAAPGKWTAILFKSASGNALGGTISITGATVISEATVQGSMDSGKVTFGVVQNDVTVATFSGSAEGDAMGGTYSLLQMNDAGSWKGTLTEVEQQAAADAAE